MAISLVGLAAAFLLLVAIIFYSKWLHARLRVIEVEGEIKRLLARIDDQSKNERALREAAQVEFASLAEKIIRAEGRVFKQSTEESVERLITPLQSRLKDFEKRVEDSYHAEGRERFALKAEVERLVSLNERMALETNQLTMALKGDSKFQGDWGEIVLETVLESSGLREGIEYLAQPSLVSSDGDRYRPDLIVRLPDGKQIVIDSKVSLTAYEQYCRLEQSGESTQRERQLKAHVDSLNRHVNELADRHYPHLKGLNTPEFVFLFTPIEPAYLLAMRHDSELATRAWKKGVAIVTATTLLTSLKTVASIWRLEHQNRNAQEIADEAAKLYDKFVGFYDDFEKLGQILESGIGQFSETRRKLRDGPGNVFRKIEQLRELGAAPNKRIRPDLLE